MEADKISIIVYGAKGLQGKKKSRFKFSAVFGIGHNKFNTEVVEDLFGAPVWNTETTINVTDASVPLKITVKEKDDYLGQVLIPLADLPLTRPGGQVKVALGQHKKSPNPKGDLYYTAWVSATRSPRLTSKQSPSDALRQPLKQLKKVKERIGQSPLMGRRSSVSKVPEPSPITARNAVSCQDLSGSMFKRKTNLVVVPSDSMSSLSSTESDLHNRFSSSCLDLADDQPRPEVTGISPKEGPVDGGTRLTIRGMNLGGSLNDIIGLTICGANILATVEYESPSKFFCTTRNWRPGKGDIVVETKSGGKGTSLVGFTFVDRKLLTPALSTPQAHSDYSGSASSSPVFSKDHRRSASGGSTPDVTASPNLRGFRDSLMTGSSLKRTPSDLSTLSNQSGSSLGIIDEGDKVPEVSGISPKEGPSEGGTRITIRGKNLGRDRNDVTSLFVCGVSCLATLEYESPRKLFCITRPWEACTGEIQVETQSGGKGTCTVMFTYVDKKRQQHVGTFGMDDSHDLDEEDLKPEVTGIAPKEGPTEGGTKLTIRGINLGLSKEDIIGMYICGADCLSSLEYESSMKLHAVTKAWRPCSGDIVVQTRSGGVGTSLVHFHYKAGKNKHKRKTPPPSPLTPVRSVSVHEEEPDPSPSTPLRSVSVHEEEPDPLPLVMESVLPEPTFAKMEEKPFSFSTLLETPPPEPKHAAPSLPPVKPPRKVQNKNADRPNSPSSVELSDEVFSNESRSAVAPDAASEDHFLGGATAYSDTGAVPYTDVGATPYADVPEQVESTGAVSANHRPVTPMIQSSSPVHEDHELNAAGHESRAQPDGQETKPSPVKERKRHAPPPPAPQQSASDNSSQPAASPAHSVSSGLVISSGQESRSVQQPPANDQQRGSWQPSTEEDLKARPSHNQQEERNNKDNVTDPHKKSNLISKLTGQDKKEKYLEAEKQKEIDTGPSKQRLYEEIDKLRFENKELKDQNRMMKQYLEELLSQVMNTCPDVLCRDSRV